MLRDDVCTLRLTDWRGLVCALGLVDLFLHFAVVVRDRGLFFPSGLGRRLTVLALISLSGTRCQVLVIQLPRW